MVLNEHAYKLLQILTGRRGKRQREIAEILTSRAE